MRFLEKSKRAISALVSTAMLVSMMSTGVMAAEIDYSGTKEYTDYTKSRFDATPTYETSQADYYYGYAPMTFAEYWASELDGTVGDYDDEAKEPNNTTGNDEGLYIGYELDDEGYTDTGMYDAVSRATVKHGIYRMQINYIVEVYGENDDGEGVIVSASAAYTGNLDEDGEFDLKADDYGQMFDDTTAPSSMAAPSMTSLATTSLVTRVCLLPLIRTM